MGKGACIKRMGAVRNYSTNTVMEKNKQRGRGEFSGVLKKYIASGFCRG